nr:hypothetical protein [Acutalibacter muris]
MWDTPFDESMLGLPQGVVVHCPDESLAEELFEIFRRNDIGKNWIDMKKTQWGEEKEETAYFIRGKELLYGPKIHAEERSMSYWKYKKCTFFGTDTPDFETATNDELIAFLGIGGG